MELDKVIKNVIKDMNATTMLPWKIREDCVTMYSCITYNRGLNWIMRRE